MKKKKKKGIILIGVFCILFLLASVWYSDTFNNGRLVAPMDFSTYEFDIKDIPILVSVMAISFYVIYLVILLFKAIFQNWKSAKSTTRTRELNPKMGLFGFFGFLGFLGVFTYQIDKTIFPFSFFIFFGFFGFFFEGKMSNTLIDERFQENMKKAQLMAFKIGFAMICFLLIIAGQGRIFYNLEYTAIIFIIGISFILGMVLFLSEYLLYRYDYKEHSEE